MPSLYVLITGFGIPFWDHKINILKHNLEMIHKYPWSKISITICQYSPFDDFQIPTELIDRYHLNIIYETGIVGEFMIKYATKEHLQDYDYVLNILDDVELIQFNWKKALEYIDQFDLDLLSPSMSSDSKIQYNYMLQEPQKHYTLKITSCCEYFCFLAKCNNFQKYHQHLDKNNPWMWGLDLILKKHLNLKVAISNTMIMKHWYKNESYKYIPDICPTKGFTYFINKYNETAKVLSEQEAILYYIIDPSTLP